MPREVWEGASVAGGVGRFGRSGKYREVWGKKYVCVNIVSFNLFFIMENYTLNSSAFHQSWELVVNVCIVFPIW